MAVSLVINGTSFSYPQTGDSKWGPSATGWAQAVTTGMLQKAGGSFTLTAEVDFGATYGLKVAYLKTETSNISLTGWARLANATDSISWRNAANSADLPLTVNSSNVLTFNGEVIPAGLIVNADVDPNAGIVFSKMAALTASILPVTDASGFITSSSVTATEAGYLSGASSNLQTQISARLQLAGGTMTGSLILNADPAVALEAATKQYVDNLVTGLQPKTPCRVASTGNVNIANGLENGDTIDGVTLSTGDRVLLKDQSTASQNGIYVAVASGAASRSTDMDTWTETLQAYVFIQAGSVNAGSGYVSQSTAGGTIGVTALPFVQFSATNSYTADGNALILTGSQFSVQLDGTTLSQSGTGLKVNQIANAQIAGAAAIAVNKLAAVTASRALVSDGSGFLSAATTTATEIGYVNGVTSAIQTQLDAKIPKTLTSSTGDMIYASSANTPARLAIGTSGYFLQSNGTIPVWTDPKISYTYIQQFGGPNNIATTFTALAISAADSKSVNPVNVTSGTQFTFNLTGTYIITLNLSLVDGTNGRQVMARLRNITDSSTNTISTACSVQSSPVGMTLQLVASPSTGKTYELQLAASGSGVTFQAATINSQNSLSYELMIERVRQ